MGGGEGEEMRALTRGSNSETWAFWATVLYTGVFGLSQCGSIISMAFISSVNFFKFEEESFF